MDMNEFHEIEKRVIELEKLSHAPVAPGGSTQLLELIDELRERIEKLEKGEMK